MTALVLNHLQAAAINAAKILPPPGSVTVIIIVVFISLFRKKWPTGNSLQSRLIGGCVETISEKMGWGDTILRGFHSNVLQKNPNQFVRICAKELSIVYCCAVIEVEAVGGTIFISQMSSCRCRRRYTVMI